MILVDCLGDVHSIPVLRRLREVYVVRGREWYEMNGIRVHGEGLEWYGHVDFFISLKSVGCPRVVDGEVRIDWEVIGDWVDKGFIV